MTNYTSKDTKCFWDRVAKTENSEDCWLWTGAKLSSGYGVKGWGFGNQLTHRIAWIVTFGKIPNKMVICHKCDNPPCCNPNHLFLGTQQDNIKDMIQKGRMAHNGSLGIKNGNHKLNIEQVSEIRSLYKKGGITHAELGKMFGISKSMIGYIVLNANWK